MQTQTLTARPDTASIWFPALPHAVAGLAIWPVFGAAACATGMLLACLATFVVFLPLTAIALNHGAAVVDGSPELTPNAKRMLFGRWAATAWLAAAVIR